MKRILTIALLFICSATLYAQNDVTKFLGIPVDGSKAEMIRKLKAKGFTVKDRNTMIGKFNGEKVSIGIATNNNKVWRIMVLSKNTYTESQIKIRFNNLLQQFEQNEKYYSGINQAISEDERIQYEIIINNRQYQASFFQKGTNSADYSKRNVWFMINYDPSSGSLLLGDGYRIAIFYDNLYNQANGEDL